MIEKLYSITEENLTEAPTIQSYRNKFIQCEAEEDAFNTAIYEARMNGFKEGMKICITLLNDLN